MNDFAARKLLADVLYNVSAGQLLCNCTNPHISIC